MTDIDPIVRAALDLLSPARSDEESPDWPDVVERAYAHRRAAPGSWKRAPSRRRGMWIGAVAALAVAAGGALAARALLDQGQPGRANTVDPATARRLAGEPALAGAPWLASSSGGVARIDQVPPRPSLVFRPGLTRQEALQQLYDSVSRRGKLPPGTHLGPPLPLGRIAVFPSDDRRGVAIDLRAPFGYELSSGVISPPILSGVSEARTPTPGIGTPLPIGATVDPRPLADCQALDPRRPSEACPVVSNPPPRELAAGVRLTRPRIAAADTPGQMVVADLDRDGIRDVLAPINVGGGASVLLGARRGLAQARTVRLPASGSLAVAELTGDGIPDLAAVGEGPLRVLRGLGDGRFRPWATAGLLPRQSGRLARDAAVAMVAADLDGDDRAEIVVWNASADVLWSFTPDGRQLSRRGIASVSGDEFFTPRPFSGVGAGRVLAAADMTGDGRDDIAVATGRRVVTLVATKEGRLRSGAVVSLPGGIAEVEAADVNGDGRSDLVTLGRTAAGVAVGRGDGSFRSPWIVTHDAAAVASAGTGDVTGDGRADLLLPHEPASVVSIYPGSGDGTFGERRDLPAGGGPTDVVVSDIDADGAIDLVVASDYHSTISLFPGLRRKANTP